MMIAEGMSVVKSAGSTHDQAHGGWWTEALCPNCGRGQFFIVAGSADWNGSSWVPDEDGVLFLRCPRCMAGVVVNDGVASPAGMPFRSIRGLGPAEEAAWDEVRSVLSVSAWTAGVMLCRKIILHIAVANGLPDKNDKGRAPSFEQAVEHLVTVGLITPPMKGWVDNIRQVGNGANHELDPISEESAMRVATFTEQLLVLAYEMPAAMEETLGATAPVKPTTGASAIDF